MRAAGIERHHDFRGGIGGIDPGDLHADRRIACAGAFALQLRDLLAVGEHGDNGDGHRLLAGAFLPVAERSLEGAKRDLAVRGLAFLLLFEAASLDVWRCRLGVEVLELEIFGISLLDRLGKAWRSFGLHRQQRCGHERGNEAEERPESGHFNPIPGQLLLAPHGALRVL